MKRVLALALVAATLAAPLSASAQPGRGGGYGAPWGDPEWHNDRARARQVPLPRVLSMLAARYPGRHLNTTMGDAGGRSAYFVQWQMHDGRVVVFVVDAESGQVIGRQGG
jgi:hypothetical protein